MNRYLTLMGYTADTIAPLKMQSWYEKCHARAHM